MRTRTFDIRSVRCIWRLEVFQSSKQTSSWRQMEIVRWYLAKFYYLLLYDVLRIHESYERHIIDGLWTVSIVVKQLKGPLSLNWFSVAAVLFQFTLKSLKQYEILDYPGIPNNKLILKSIPEHDFFRQSYHLCRFSLLFLDLDFGAFDQHLAQNLIPYVGVIGMETFSNLKIWNYFCKILPAYLSETYWISS